MSIGSGIAVTSVAASFAFVAYTTNEPRIMLGLVTLGVMYFMMKAFSGK